MTSKSLALAFLMAFCGNSAAQQVPTSQSAEQKPLSLTRANDGQHVSAKVGQPIVITLQTIGPGAYGTPQISSRAVRFDGSRFAHPREQNPGGPKQYYHFTAIAEGEAQIRIPHTYSNPTVTFTFQVTKP